MDRPCQTYTIKRKKLFHVKIIPLSKALVAKMCYNIQVILTLFKHKQCTTNTLYWRFGFF